MNVNPASVPSTSVENDTPWMEDACSICYVPFNSREREVKPEIVKTQCNHFFDEDCITEWLNQPSINSRSCAMCQQLALPLQRTSGARFYESSPFCEAKPLQICRNGDDLGELQNMLKSEPSIAHYEFRSARSGMKLTLLHIACQEGHIGHMQALIAKGADLNATSQLKRGYDANPLMLASLRGHTKIVKDLVIAGAKIDTISMTALFLAAQNGHTETVKELIKVGATIDTPIKDGGTPLMTASQNGHTETVKELIKAGATIDIPNEDGMTPLIAASAEGHTEIVTELINEGAEVNTRSPISHWTPLFFAAHSGHTETLKELIDAGANINIPDKDGITPLEIATANGHEDCVRVLRQYQPCQIPPLFSSLFAPPH